MKWKHSWQKTGNKRTEYLLPGTNPLLPRYKPSLNVKPGHFVLRENGRKIGFLSNQLLMHYSIVYKSTLMLWEIHIMNLLIAGFIFALVSSQVKYFYLSTKCHGHKFLGSGICGRHHKRIWNVSRTTTNADESTARIHETSKRSYGRSHTQ